MKIITTLFLICATTEAFTVTTNFAANKVQTALSMSTPTETKSKMDRTVVRKAISKMTAETFASTLSDIEPFLLNEAGISFHTKSLRRIGHQAKELGMDVPENYAKEAKATAKRREKQDAFIKVKIEEAAAAEAAAAEATTEDEAAPAEVETEEEPVAA